MGAPQVINKLLKEDMNDANLFFKMGLDKISEICLGDIKQEGKKSKIALSLKEYFEKYKKDGSVKYQGIMLIKQPKLLLKKSTSVERNLNIKEEPNFFSSDDEDTSDL